MLIIRTVDHNVLVSILTHMFEKIALNKELDLDSVQIIDVYFFLTLHDKIIKSYIPVDTQNWLLIPKQECTAYT